MEQILTNGLSMIAPTALPVVVLVLGLFWIYRKTQNIEESRKVTKTQRDEEFMKVHDQLLRHSFDIDSLKGTSNLHAEVLADLQKQVSIVIKELAELNVNMKILIDEKKK